jgi:hypothetical protein
MAMVHEPEKKQPEYTADPSTCACQRWARTDGELSGHNTNCPANFFLVFNPHRHAVSDYSTCKPEIEVHIFIIDFFDGELHHCYCGATKLTL